MAELAEMDEPTLVFFVEARVQIPTESPSLDQLRLLLIKDGFLHALLDAMAIGNQAEIDIGEITIMDEQLAVLDRI